MAKKQYIIPLLIILIPIILLLICSWKHNNNENFTNKINEENTQLKNWKDLRYFKPKNVNQ